MIKTSKYHAKPNEPESSVLDITIAPRLGEAPEDFLDRVARLANGMHQIEIKIVIDKPTGPEARVLVELNPGAEEPEEFDANKFSRSELLSDFSVDPQKDRRNKTNVEY